MIAINKINYKLVNFAIISLIFFLFFKTSDIWLNLFYIIKKTIAPILISFVIAYSLFPIVKLLNAKLKNNNLAVFIILIFFLTILFFIFYLSIPLLVNQTISLAKEVLPFLEKMFSNITFINLSFFEDLLINNINNFIYKLSSSPIKLVVNSLSFITNLILVAILSIYFLLNMEKIRKKVAHIFINKIKTYKILKEIDMSLNNYLKGLFIIIFIEIIEYTFIYFVIGHPNFLLLGLLAGFTTIIPYFGGLFTNILALITAASYSSNLFYICAVIVIVLPIVDSYIIDPKIYHKTTKLNPLKIIIAIIVCTSIFGMFGLLISVPIYLILEVLIKKLVLN